MITPELLDFVRLQLSRGMARVKVSELLLSQGGWSREDIGEVFREYDRENTPGFALPLAGVGNQTDLEGQVDATNPDDFLGMFTADGSDQNQASERFQQETARQQREYTASAPMAEEEIVSPVEVLSQVYAEPEVLPPQEQPQLSVSLSQSSMSAAVQNLTPDNQITEAKIIRSFPQTTIKENNPALNTPEMGGGVVSEPYIQPAVAFAQNEYLPQVNNFPAERPQTFPPSQQYVQPQVAYVPPQAQPQFIQPSTVNPNPVYQMPQVVSIQPAPVLPQPTPQIFQSPLPAPIPIQPVAQSMQQVQDAARVFADEFVATLKAKAAEVTVAAVAPTPLQPVPTPVSTVAPATHVASETVGTTPKVEKVVLTENAVVADTSTETVIKQGSTTSGQSPLSEEETKASSVPKIQVPDTVLPPKNEVVEQKIPPVEIIKEEIVPNTIASPDMSKLVDLNNEVKPSVATPHEKNNDVIEAKSSDKRDEAVAAPLHVAPITIKPISTNPQPDPKPVEVSNTTQPPKSTTPIVIPKSEIEVPAASDSKQSSPTITLNIQPVANTANVSAEHVGARTFEPTKTVVPPNPAPVVTSSASVAHPTHSSTLGKKTYQDILKQALNDNSQTQPGDSSEKKIVAKSSMESWLEGVKSKRSASQPVTESRNVSEAPSSAASKAEPPQGETKVDTQGGGTGQVFPKVPKITKQKINIIFIVLVTLAVLGGVSYAIMRYVGPNASNVLQTSFSDLVGATSVSYKGNSLIDLSFDRTEFGGGKGAMKFEMNLSGGMKNSPQGFGDGTHDFAFEGALNSGTVIWATKVAGQARLIGQTLYINATTPPLNASLDPDLLKNYWIKIDLDQIAQELALQGIGNTEPYGAFSDPNSSQNFMSILSRNFPLLPAGNSTIDTSVAGVETYRYPLALDGAKSLAVAKEIYQSLMQKPLVVSEEEALRWADAMKKAEISVWIGKNDGKIYRFTLQFKPEDSIIGVRTTGVVSIDINILGLSAPIGVTEPTPSLGLDDLKVRMEQYRSLLAVRANDVARVTLLGEVANALDMYAGEKGRYPILLDELWQGKYLSGMATTTDLSIFSYYPYAATATPSKATRCTQRSRGCTNYHIGVNFDDQTHPMLSEDKDVIGEILGGDDKGCAGEEGRSCYDVFKTYIPPTIVSTSTTSTSTVN